MGQKAHAPPLSGVAAGRWCSSYVPYWRVPAQSGGLRITGTHIAEAVDSGD